MFLVLNILALLAMAAVAYMSATYGVYRAAVALAAGLVAGLVAFGFFGPVTDLAFSDSPQSTWFYAGDAIALWALFAFAFLALRTIGEHFFKHEAPFGTWINRIGGGALGAATGFVTVGVCMVVLQMLPTAPDFFGYEPFKYQRRTNSVGRGADLWLQWDRGVIELYAYLLGGPHGPVERGPLARYGDLYPPPEMRTADEEAEEEAPPGRRTDGHAGGIDVLNADDMLYYHWYRRYLYIMTSVKQARGPIPDVEAMMAALPGIWLDNRRTEIMQDLEHRISRVETIEGLEEFPDLAPAEGRALLKFELDFQPIDDYEDFPLTVDTSQYVLIRRDGRRYENPRIFGKAREVDGKPVVETRRTSPEITARGVRFAIPENRVRGAYLADGATLVFDAPHERHNLEFIYSVPAATEPETVRLLLEPAKTTPETTSSDAPEPDPGT